MLKLKILKGNLKGQELLLKGGENIIGRAENSDVVIPANGVSKKHAKILVQSDRCIITDLNSSNGTFVNGARVQTRILKPGDRIGFHDVICELMETSKGGSQVLTQAPPGPTIWNTNVAHQQVPLTQAQEIRSLEPQGQNLPAQPNNLGEYAQSYLHKVILPGVYKINESYSTPSIISGFVIVFVIITALLASIPMAQLTQEGIQKESQRRALTLARQLATLSEKALAMPGEGAIQTDSFENEDGVTTALVVAKIDGHIIAPATKAQQYSSEEFVARALKSDETMVSQLGANLIGASVPVRSYSAEAGRYQTSALAIILYKVDSTDLSSAMGVFGWVLILAFAIGGVIFFLMYQVFVHPLRLVSSQLDEALRGDRDAIETKYEFPILTKLIENINSAISRMSSGGNNQQPLSSFDRQSEARNIVRIITDPSFALGPDLNFLEVNFAFSELVGMGQAGLQGQSLDTLQEQALAMNLKDLAQKSIANPGLIQSTEFEILGTPYEFDMQASPDQTGISYLICTIKKKGAVHG